MVEGPAPQHGGKGAEPHMANRGSNPSLGSLENTLGILHAYPKPQQDGDSREDFAA